MTSLGEGSAGEGTMIRARGRGRQSVLFSFTHYKVQFSLSNSLRPYIYSCSLSLFLPLFFSVAILYLPTVLLMFSRFLPLQSHIYHVIRALSFSRCCPITTVFLASSRINLVSIYYLIHALSLLPVSVLYLSTILFMLFRFLSLQSYTYHIIRAFSSSPVVFFLSLSFFFSSLLRVLI